MGLDQYIFRVRKPKIANRIYTADEIRAMGFCRASVADFETNANLYEQLKPYVVKRGVQLQFYDIEKMIADYNLPEDSNIWHQSGEYIEIGGRNEDGVRIDQKISNDEIREKYTKTEVVPCYVWEEVEVHYWRKNYGLQDWIYDTIEGVDNTGYYVLNEDLIGEINYSFGANIPEENPSEDSALFYWEWY